MKSKIILFVTALIILTGLVSASFKFAGEIDQQYSAGEKISGSFNMSFSNHPNENFSSNFEGGLSLLALLTSSDYTTGQDFICNPSNCEKGFNALNPQTSRIININGTKELGFLLSGNDVSINSFRLNISSNIPASCLNQLSLDILEDNYRDFYNNNYLNETCTGRNYGCFIDSNSSEIIIPASQQPYCERITLPAAPAYKIGAKVVNSTVSGELKMWLYDPQIGDSAIGSCTLPKHSSPTQDLDCVVPYSSKNQFNSFVCISAAQGTNYKIKKEGNSPCGLEGTDFSQNFQLDYEIYAQSLKYAPISAKFDESLFQKLNPEKDGLIVLLQNYIDDKYNADCTQNCIIPFSLFGATQAATLSSLEIIYSFTGASGGTTEDRIYDLSQKDFTINSSSLDFDFERLGFIVPIISANATRIFTLSFGNQSIFNKQIKISSSAFEFDISPKIVLIAQDIQYSIIISNSTNITRSSWNFGDNSEVVVSDGKKAVHKYIQAGEYSVSVEVTRSDGVVSTKTFKIATGDLKTSINSTISLYEKRIVNLSKSVASFPSWISDELNSNLKISDLNSSIQAIKAEYSSATEDSYQQILDKLLALDVPYSISIRNSGTLPLTISLENADLSLIEKISNKEAKDKDDLQKSILAWMNQNYDSKISFETISKFSDTGSTPILTKFKIDANPKNDPVSQSYLIIGFPEENINFQTSYSQKPIESGTFISLESVNSVEFFLVGDVKAGELGAYISPDMQNLNNIEIIGPSGKPYPLKTVIILIIIIFFVVFGIYIALQEWYKRHYEDSLFKNRNDLYNLINFIYNARASGLVDSQIRKKLGESGWRGEQITYALRKISGKRTGMFEIPLFKFVENKKVKQELEKRQKNPLDARFIKR